MLLESFHKPLSLVALSVLMMSHRFHTRVEASERITNLAQVLSLHRDAPLAEPSINGLLTVCLVRSGELRLNTSAYHSFEVSEIS